MSELLHWTALGLFAVALIVGMAHAPGGMRG